MAVYKHTYRGYSGGLTPAWPRFLILPRYSYARLFQSKFLITFLMACFFYPLGCAAFIYLSHNLAFLKTFNIPIGRALDIDNTFFLYYCNVQGTMASLLTALVGPSLVSPDLTNRALPLYFCRPFSRAEYVAGKMAVLLFLLSLMTWIPGLILFGIQGSQAGWQWMADNLWIASGIFWGLLLWTVMLSLIALAMSAWVRWKIAAGGLILGVFFAGAGFGAAINSVMRTKYGSLIDLSAVIYAVWEKLLRHAAADQGFSLTDAWIALAVAGAICLMLLVKRVRPFEVVK
jgi:ABC-2 type transport system permease protein